jgi:hypothetical protein
MSTLRDDPLVQLMLAASVTPTREGWIDLNYGREVPNPWTAELEGEVPEELQDWTKVRMEP